MAHETSALRHPRDSQLLSRHTLNVRYSSKAEVVCQLLREAILTGEMRPGQRIVVDPLAERLGISKIPIREALGRLTAERLVELTPHVGARVAAPPTTRDLHDIYAVRATLEAMAAAMAARTIVAREIARLGRILAQESRLLAKPLERTVYTRLNREFHLIIFQATGNGLLGMLCEEVFDRSTRYRASAGALQTQHPHLLHEHQEILDCLERRDARRASAVMRRHVERGFRRLLPFLEAEDAGRSAPPKGGRRPGGVEK